MNSKTNDVNVYQFCSYGKSYRRQLIRKSASTYTKFIVHHPLSSKTKLKHFRSHLKDFPNSRSYGLEIISRKGKLSQKAFEFIKECLQHLKVDKVWYSSTSFEKHEVIDWKGFKLWLPLIRAYNLTRLEIYISDPIFTFIHYIKVLKGVDLSVLSNWERASKVGLFHYAYFKLHEGLTVKKRSRLSLNISDSLKYIKTSYSKPVMKQLMTTLYRKRQGKGYFSFVDVYHCYSSCYFDLASTLDEYYPKEPFTVNVNSMGDVQLFLIIKNSL